MHFLLRIALSQVLLLAVERVDSLFSTAGTRTMFVAWLVLCLFDTHEFA